MTSNPLSDHIISYRYGRYGTNNYMGLTKGLGVDSRVCRNDEPCDLKIDPKAEQYKYNAMCPRASRAKMCYGLDSSSFSTITTQSHDATTSIHKLLSFSFGVRSIFVFFDL
jgi:hypothetical protein